MEERWFSGEVAALGLGKQVQLTVLPKASCVAWDTLLLCPSVPILKLQSSSSSLLAQVSQGYVRCNGNMRHEALLC